MFGKIRSMRLFGKKVYYFIHIYKTGGTTVKDMLHRNFHGNQIADLYYSQWGSTAQNKEILKVHEKMQLNREHLIVFGHFAYGAHKRSRRSYEYMTFVREPADRLVSTFYHLNRLDKAWQFRILNGLDEKINTEADLQSFFPNMEKYMAYSGIQNQQCMFLTGYEPEVIAQDPEHYAKEAINNITKDFSFIGLTEKFEESLKRLEGKLDLSTTSYDYKNFGSNKPRSFDLDSKIKKKVYETSKADAMIYEFVRDKYYS